MNPAEQHYETHDGELLAIVEGFKQYRHYLEGATQAVQVLTDHNNLRGFMGVKQLNGRQARWATFLASFDFVIEHRPGKTNPADGPSRRPDYEGGEHAASHLLPTLQNKLAVWGADTDLAQIVRRVRLAGGPPVPKQSSSKYEDVTLSIRSVVNAITRSEEAFEDPCEDLTNLLRKLQATDVALHALRELADSADEAEAWVQHDQLWYYKLALYVPNDSAVRAELMRIHHDDELAGHFGRDKTEALLRRKYFWPELAKEVAEYVKTCSVCQTMKARHHRPYGEAQALPMPSRAWEEITMDFITDLPPGKLGDCVYDAILVIVDRYTKMNRYLPTTKKCTSVELAELLELHIVRHYGLPKGIITDRGSVFTSQYWSDFAFEARIKRRLSTAFHPQTDGQTERMNQTLKQYL